MFLTIIHRLSTFTRHFFTAKDEHALHSPFLFRFYINCLKSINQYYCFNTLNAARINILSSKKNIRSFDYGAGQFLNRNKSVAAIAKHSLSSKNECEVLFQISNYLQPKTIIELGTSFGISSAYLSAYSTDVHCFSWEGNPDIAEYAKELHDSLKIKNISIFNEQIDQHYPQFLKNNQPQIDLLYIDANHTYEACMKYVELSIPYLHNNSIVIIDDIYWSPGMTKAWQELTKDKRFSVNLDCYKYGILFLRKEQKKQSFRIHVPY